MNKGPTEPSRSFSHLRMTQLVAFCDTRAQPAPIIGQLDRVEIDTAQRTRRGRRFDDTVNSPVAEVPPTRKRLAHYVDFRPNWQLSPRPVHRLLGRGIELQIERILAKSGLEVGIFLPRSC